MFRISDIFQKYKKEEKKRLEMQDNKISAKEAPVQRQGKINISAALSKELEKIDVATAVDLYEGVLSKVKNVYVREPIYDAGLAASLGTLIAKTADVLSTDDNGLLRLCLSDYPRMQDYLYYHVVNVCIISILLGLGLGYERSHLYELGVAAFMHDIGETKYLDLICKPSVLTHEEYGKIRLHPSIGGEILNKIGRDLSHGVFDVARQEHERIDGSGYPAGLKNGQICEYARIVGLADVYEAMVHTRPYRNKHTPLETIKEILNNKNAFDYNIIKTLIERIGIFPVGMLVRLNTKETAVVLEDSPKLPLRPIVKIIFDANGRELKEPKQIDLADNSVIYIEECLDCLGLPGRETV